jgi:hypothetical protein
LASDPFQTRMLRNFVRRKVDPSVAMIPMVEDSLRAMEPEMRDPVIDPAPAFRKDFVSLKKRQGLLKRIWGTLGKNIDSTLYPQHP